MTFIIFIAAVFTVLFFVLGVIFKGLASMFNGVVNSVSFIAAIGFLGGLTAGGLYLVYTIVNGIMTDGIMSVIGNILMFFLYVVIIFMFVGWLGQIALMVIAAVISVAMGLVSDILDFAAMACECAYAYFLKAIVNQLEKN